MLVYIALAVLNGAVIGTNRALNGRLSVDLGPFRASFWNHWVGFLFISFVLLVLSQNMGVNAFADIPRFTYIGGFMGALFVGVASYVFPRLGATQSSLLIIGGQMISSVFFDFSEGSFLAHLGEFVGIAAILFGVYLSK